jgi:hypothetical protein
MQNEAMVVPVMGSVFCGSLESAVSFVLVHLAGMSSIALQMFSH